MTNNIKLGRFASLAKYFFIHKTSQLCDAQPSRNLLRPHCFATTSVITGRSRKNKKPLIVKNDSAYCRKEPVCRIWLMGYQEKILFARKSIFKSRRLSKRWIGRRIFFRWNWFNLIYKIVKLRFNIIYKFVKLGWRVEGFSFSWFIQWSLQM